MDNRLALFSSCELVAIFFFQLSATAVEGWRGGGAQELEGARGRESGATGGCKFGGPVAKKQSILLVYKNTGLYYP